MVSRTLFLWPLLAVSPAWALGTLELRGLFDSLRPKSSQVAGASWEASFPLRLSWDLGRWAEAQAQWGWGGGSYQGTPGLEARHSTGALPFGLSAKAKTGEAAGTLATGQLSFASAGDLALNRGLRVDSYLPETRGEERLLGGGRVLRMELGAESRMGRGRWRLTFWTEDEGSFPAEGLGLRLDPGTSGGLRFQGRLGRDREEKVALTLASERRPSYRAVDAAGTKELFGSHSRNEIRLEGWTNLGRRLGLGLILMESDRSGASLPASRGPEPALWPQFRTGPTLEAVLGLRHWMPGDASAFYSAGILKAAANDAEIGSDIRDDGWRGFFLSAEAETALSPRTGAGWKASWTKTRDLGAAPDAAAGEAGRSRARLRLELNLYRIF